MEQEKCLGAMRKIWEGYGLAVKPVCRTYDLPLPAYSILMALANGAEDTAKDISKSNGIKPTLISFHVEKLVQLGYIERRAVDGDRRRIKLVCTPKAQPIIDAGKRAQQQFTEKIFAAVSPQERADLQQILAKLASNVDDLIKMNKEEQ